MNYFEKLKNRSVFLWRALFEVKHTKELLPPVYIDRAPGQRKLPGAHVDTAERVPQAEAEQMTSEALRGVGAEQRMQKKLPQTAQDAEKQEHVLHGMEAMETALRRAALKKESAVVRKDVHQSNEKHSAQLLLQRVQETAQSGMYPQNAAVYADQISDGERQMIKSAAPEEWSAYFEKDARRYDGACELM